MTKLDFIHIGLGKCMSTRLQGHWDKDAGYNALSGQGISSAIDKIILECGSSPQAIEAALSGLNLNFPPFSSSVTNILTSEDLTFSYLHSPERADAIRAKDEAAAKLLAPLTDKVLMLVRDPVDWIRSCHAQQVKEGGSVPLAEYLNTHRAVILNNLNLDRRIDAWSRLGVDVIILPTELATRSDDDFWTAYEKRLDVSRPSNWTEKFGFVTTNITSYETLEPHRRMNELMHLLERSLQNADLPQKAETLNMMETTRRFGIRWGFSAADTDTLSDIVTSLNMEAEPEGPGELCLDEDYLTTLEDTFLSPLRNDLHFEPYACLDAYTDNLQAHGQLHTRPAAVSGAAAG